MRQKLLLISLVLLSLHQLTAQSSTIQHIPNPQTGDANNFVSNPDNILEEKWIAEFNQKIAQLKKTNGTEVAIVAVKSIGEENIDLLATNLFEQWKIGKEQQDNGLLILFVQDIRKIVLRTGYGLEGVLPDIKTAQIIRQQIAPSFRKGNYEQGLSLALDEIIDTVQTETFEPVSKKNHWDNIAPYIIPTMLILALLLIWQTRHNIKKVQSNPVLTTNLARYKRLKEIEKGTTSTIYSLSILIGLGGAFLFRFHYLLAILLIPLSHLPALLYSVYKTKKIRQNPIPCNSCKGTMHFLTEKEEDSILNITQQFEEEIRSMDYDVFVCQDCHNQAIFSLQLLTPYTHCPRCHTKAYKLHKSTTLIAPTYISAGTKRKTYKCYYCGYEDHKTEKMNRLHRNSSSSTIGGAIGGGVFSGRGGFGGSSGGSFGGGMTGGGGASGSW